MNKKILTIIFALFVVLIVLRHHVPKPVDWNLSFSSNNKNPYGCSIAKEVLNSIFPGKKVETNLVTFFIGLKKPSKGQNLIIVCDKFSPDDLDLDALLEFASIGNSVFISSLGFPEVLCDTLLLKTNEPMIDTSFFRKMKERLVLYYTSELKDSGYQFTKRMPDHFFDSFDSTTTIVLGSDRSGRPNFIHARFGYGNIYLHCQPMALTNFHMLYGNYQYACSALSVLPVSNTIWDQYYKPGKVIDSSPVRYILSNPPLRSAWYVILAMLTIFLVFGSRRMQRAIPVIQPPENTSLNFIRSIGKLYFKSSNHADLAKKKLMYFREFLKNKYNLKPPFNTREQVRVLNEKSGVETEIIESLITVTEDLEKKEYINKEELLHIHHIIEKFYKTCK